MSVARERWVGEVLAQGGEQSVAGGVEGVGVGWGWITERGEENGGKGHWGFCGWRVESFFGKMEGVKGRCWWSGVVVVLVWLLRGWIF